MTTRSQQDRTERDKTTREDPGSVLQALAGLRVDAATEAPPPAPPQPPSPAFLPARPSKPRVEPGTGIIDVHALAARARAVAPAAPRPPTSRPPTVIVARPPRPAPAPAAPPTPAPPADAPAALRRSQAWAFLLGALLGTGVFAVSLLLGAATSTGP